MISTSRNYVLVYLADTEDQAWEDCQDHLFSMMEFLRPYSGRGE